MPARRLVAVVAVPVAVGTVPVEGNDVSVGNDVWEAAGHEGRGILACRKIRFFQCPGSWCRVGSDIDYRTGSPEEIETGGRTGVVASWVAWR